MSLHGLSALKNDGSSERQKPNKVSYRHWPYFMMNRQQQTYRNPKPTVDIIIQYRGGIVLIKRKNPPYGWALPGGYVDYGEALEHAAIREAKEETGLQVKLLRQFHTYSDPRRDRRGHTISTVFVARGYGTLRAGDDAQDAAVFKRTALPRTIVFDHKTVLRDYIHKRY